MPIVADMPRLFQINEDDLSDLERILPQFAEVMESNLDNKLRGQIRRVQSILTNVRWDYGPPHEVEEIPAHDC